MSDETQTPGRRIRTARLAAQMSQSGLAKAAGISPSYLNLIEHGRRTVGGKVLISIAGALNLSVSQIEGVADPRQVAALKIAQGLADLTCPTEDPEQLIGLSPGWAGVITSLVDRYTQLEQEREVYGQGGATEAELYELISAVTSIRSSASILLESDGIDRDWQRRFATNIHSEALRLEEHGQNLIERLGPGASQAEDAPKERLQAALQVGPLPEDRPAAVILEERGADLSDPFTRTWATRFHGDRTKLPAPWLEGLGRDIRDPFAFAARTGLPADVVLRRLAFSPDHGRPAGLIIADRSGALTLAAPPPKFPIAAHSAPCALWPLFDALGAPGVPASRKLELPGGATARFACHAFGQRQLTGGAGAPALTEVTMLVLGDATDIGAVTRSAPSCPACANLECPARREPQRR